MQSGYTSDEIDAMKREAINRARQMRSRASINPVLQCVSPEQEKQQCARENPNSNAFFSLSKMLNFDSDELILIAIILLLKSNRENLPIIIALLYIAM